MDRYFCFGVFEAVVSVRAGVARTARLYIVLSVMADYKGCSCELRFAQSGVVILESDRLGLAED